MPSTLLPERPRFLRQRMLGSEAVYRILGEDDRVVTAEVVHAPGLERGTRVRLLARAARSMERIEPVSEPITLTRRLVAAGAH